MATTTTTVKNSSEKEQYLNDDNPIIISDEKIENIDATFNTMHKNLIQLSEKYELNEDQVKYLVKALNEVYLERKTNAIILNRTSHLSNMLTKLVRTVFRPNSEDDKSLNLYYYNKTKHSIRNEW
jgi:hypothetical protein